MHVGIGCYYFSTGWLNGDTVVCGYHGLRFNADGRCTFFMPSQETISPAEEVEVIQAGVNAAD